MKEIVPPTDEQIQKELAEMKAAQAASAGATGGEAASEAAADAAPEAAPEPAKPKFSKTISVDGQERTFSGETLEEVLDQISEAHAALVKKAQQLKLQAKFAGESAKQKPTPQIADPKDLSADEMFEVAADLTQNPAKAFDRLFQARVGMTPAQFREYQRQQAATAEEQRQQAAVAQFRQAHPEYAATPNNGNRMSRLLELKGLPVNFQTLETVYEELFRDGLLESAPTTTAPASASSVPAQEQRKPTRTGLKATNSASGPTRTVPTEADLRTMPLKDLERLIRSGQAR